MSWMTSMAWTVVVLACFAALVGFLFLLLMVWPPLVLEILLGVSIFGGLAFLIKTSPTHDPYKKRGRGQ